MRLNYYKGNNFGDALNPLIFHKLLPDFFDDDPAIDFFGIGSIIGANMKEYERKIIFSSGFAYGTKPTLDASYDIISVRGPLTAKALNIDPNLGIVDGAALLREFNFTKPAKAYDFTFMPHFESEKKYPWEKICREAGIHYVSPTSDPLFVIDEILKSKTVIAEAMHYAIVADVLRVPWIAVKAYPGINDFKWNDWTKSLDMEYNPTSLGSLFQEPELNKKLKEKTNGKLPGAIYTMLTKAYIGYQEVYLKGATVKGLRDVTRLAPQLSKDNVFHEKTDRLLEKLSLVRQKYMQNSPAINK